MSTSLKGPKRIFIVDDEPDVALSLKIVLEKYGFLVNVFTDPSIALKNFEPELCDLLILDIKMPGISGFELYSKLKLKAINLKTIFLTALKDLENYGTYKDNVSPKYGERHFVQKPVSNIELLNQVYSMVN